MSDAPTCRDDEVAWGIRSRGESRWPALLATLAAIALQLVLPNSLLRGLGNRALIPSLEGGLLLVLLIANPGHISKEESRLRMVGLALIALITVANVVSLIELIHALLYPAGNHAGGRPLVYASVPIWLTNVIVFGLWYWELDRAGRPHVSSPTTGAPTSSSPRCRRRDPPRGGHPTSSTTCTRRSPMRPLSAPQTRCR